MPPARRFTPEDEKTIRGRLKTESYADVARDYGISRQRLQQFVNRPNPKGRTKKYPCVSCGKEFESRSQYRPERCAECGSDRWDAA